MFKEPSSYSVFVSLCVLPYRKNVLLPILKTYKHETGHIRYKPKLAHKQSPYDADCIASSIRDTRNATSRTLAGDKADIACQTETAADDR